MTPRDFCYWLQGYFEISLRGDEELSRTQIERIKSHLALVFAHSIDPETDGGDPEKKAALDAIHQGSGRPPKHKVYRC